VKKEYTKNITIVDYEGFFLEDLKEVFLNCGVSENIANFTVWNCWEENHSSGYETVIDKLEEELYELVM